MLLVGAPAPRPAREPARRATPSRIAIGIAHIGIPIPARGPAPGRRRGHGAQGRPKETRG